MTLQHIYIYVVKLKAGPRFGGFKVKTGPSLKLKTGPSLKLKIGPSFFHCLSPFLQCFGVALKTQIVSHCAKIVFLQKFG